MLVSRRVAAALVVALNAGIIGCGSSEGSDEGDPKPQVESGPPLEIFFKTLNTAFIPNSSRKFQVPAVVQGVKPDTWEVSEKGAVDFEYGAVENGVMITPRKAGKFKITATAGKRVGSVDLNVTAATEDDWMRGSNRYNNNIQLMFGMGVMAGGMMVPNNVSCKGCHGSGATFLAVEHTPQQTGGYSDDEIKKIFQEGMKPEGAIWGSLPGIMMYYPLFHKWMAEPEDYQGLVIYLRSLEPKSQGMLDFGNLAAMYRNRMGMGMGMGGVAGGAAPAPMPAAAGGPPSM